MPDKKGMTTKEFWGLVGSKQPDGFSFNTDHYDLPMGNYNVQGDEVWKVKDSPDGQTWIPLEIAEEK